jgi:hypothetical protein
MMSPFGETFRFRTHLSEQECYRRLDSFAPASLADAFGNFDFSGSPVSSRKWGYIFLSFPAEPYGAELIAKLRPLNGSTEIRGRAGSNIMLFLVIAAVTSIAIGALLIDWAERNFTAVPWGVIAVPPFAVGYYLLKRRNPFGGPLIDHIQQLLEAEPIVGRTGDPIKRY